ncbi:MAG: ATP-binding cassette domain-containing protein [Faecalibacterium prausnitzii]
MKSTLKKSWTASPSVLPFTAGNTSTALLGASGCGKSMTLRCIAGIVKPDRGRIVLDGRVLFDSAQHIDLPPQQRGVGLLFQNYALFPI